MQVTGSWGMRSATHLSRIAGQWGSKGQSWSHPSSNPSTTPSSLALAGASWKGCKDAVKSIGRAPGGSLSVLRPVCCWSALHAYNTLPHLVPYWYNGGCHTWGTRTCWSDFSKCRRINLKRLSDFHLKWPSPVVYFCWNTAHGVKI